MSVILAEVNAGANERFDEIIRTLELTCPTWTESVSITSGCVFASNSTANYSLATSVDHLSGCQSSSGALLNVTGPGAA